LLANGGEITLGEPFGSVQRVTKLLPALVAAGTALITTAMIQSVFGLFWLGHYLFDEATPVYNWERAFTVSAIATAVVLVASVVALRLIRARQFDGAYTDDGLPVPGDATPMALRIAGTRK
jgi:hypothetical protein